MTREERLNEMNRLKALAESKAKSYNEAVADKEKAADIIKIANEIDQAVNEYKSHAKEVLYEDCRNDPDGPMMHAVKTLTYEVIKVKDEPIDPEVKNAGMKRTIVTVDVIIDLADLHKHVDGGIGVDPEWLYAAEKLNFHLTMRQCERLGVDPKEINDSYAMAELSRQKDLGKNPTSKTTMLKTLQMVISAMIGEEYKAVSHDVNYLLDVYATAGRKALSVKVANHKKFREYMLGICHRCVTGATYEVIAPLKKK